MWTVLKVFLDRPNYSVSGSSMKFLPPKCQMLLQEWDDSKPNLVLAARQLNEVERFSYFCGCISPGGCISDEVSSRI